LRSAPSDLRRLGWSYPSGSQKTDKTSQACIMELCVLRH